jgi:hypothetical protein
MGPMKAREPLAAPTCRTRSGVVARSARNSLAALQLTVCDPLVARLRRGGPAIARPVTAAHSEHPAAVVHCAVPGKQLYQMLGGNP